MKLGIWLGWNQVNVHLFEYLEITVFIQTDIFCSKAVYAQAR